MLQVSSMRPAFPADLHLTKCPNALTLRLKSKDAGHPAAAGYNERRALVGCRNADCEVCQRENATARIIRWKQRIKALLAYETSHRDVQPDSIRFATLTFPPHPEGDQNRDGAPDHDMVNDTWKAFRRELSHWYNRHGVKARDAVNYIAFEEHGGRKRRLHMHVLFCYRPGFPHPHIEEPREHILYLHKQYLGFDGIGKIWAKVLKAQGFTEPNPVAFYHSPVRDIDSAAAYCVSAYLIKGFMGDETYRVKAAQQSPPWPDVLSWHRDKRFNLQGEQYRRWIGFKLSFNEVTPDNLSARCRELAHWYCDTYASAVSIGDGGNLRKVRRSELNANRVTKSLLVELSACMNRQSENRRRMYGNEGNTSLPTHITLHPVMVALSDRPVQHPASADFLSVAEFFEDGGFGPAFELPSPLRDERFNLCGASHWFPVDDGNLTLRTTEVYEELMSWSKALFIRFSQYVIEALDKSLPGSAHNFVTQGMPVPLSIVDGQVELIASQFPKVFPDTDIAPRVVPIRKVDTRPVQLGQVDAEVVAALEKTTRWDARAFPPVFLPRPWPRHFALKEGQCEIIDRIELRKESGIYALPTSFGKSLCYQYPPVEDGITLVVSPLLSLIRDQVQALERLGIRATWIGGEHNAGVKNARLESVGAIGMTGNEEHAIVYASPESFALAGEERFLARYLREGYINVSHLVIDEAHCVSQWCDFRPAYRRIPEAISTWMYPPSVVSCFSATISPRILSDLRHAFGPLPFFSLPVTRDNLSLHRVPTGFYEFFSTAAFEGLDTPMLVYAGQRLRTEELAAFLRDQGLNARHYHAGCEDREEIETAFREGDIDILCATVAYGMGIDHPNLRTVIHDSLPASIEDFTQQVGRAGRDGQPSACVLLSNPAMLSSPDMEAYFASDSCLWQFIARHHGQPASACGNCDVCSEKRVI